MMVFTPITSRKAPLNPACTSHRLSSEEDDGTWSHMPEVWLHLQQEGVTIHELQDPVRTADEA